MTATEPENRQSAFFPPIAPPFTAPPLAPVPPKAAEPATAGASAPVLAAFETDAPAAPAKFALAPLARALLQRVAELARRPDAPTPFAIGLLAPAGGGKSSALNWVNQAVAAPGAPVAALNAAELAAEPERALAAALYRAVSLNYAPLANEAAHEGAHFGADAGALSRATQEKLDALRRKLQSERQNLAQTQARRAALTETMLYDTPGSRVDAYARRLRAAFEPRLRRFGFTGDALTNFKDLTRDLAETGGVATRLAHSLRAFYAFRGQTRLLVYAAAFFGLNWGASWLAVNRKDWLAALSASSAQGAQASEFLAGRLDWLPPAAQICALIGLGLLALNFWRAFSFMQPLFRAAGLLDEDVAAKGHELDQNLAQQARSADMLAAETATVARQAAEAERRAAAAGASKHPPLFLESDSAAQKRDFSLGFLQSLSQHIARGGKDTPQKLIVTVDGLEGVAQPAALFERLNDLLARPGFIAIYALDPEILGGPGARLARRIQLPLRLDAGRTGESVPALAALDAELPQPAAGLLDAAAPLAGDNPRAQKRLRNLFRFLRPSAEAPAGLSAALVLWLAAHLGGSPEDRQALDRAIHGDGFGFAPAGSMAMRDALAMAQQIGGPIDRAQARQAAALARHVLP